MRRAVLLDLYGTLVEADWAELLKGRAALAERVGLPAAAAHRAWETTHVARMTGTYGSLADDLGAVFTEASNGRGPSSTSAGLLSQLARDELENWRGGVRLYPEAVPALRRLRAQGLRLAIVTNASAEAASVTRELALRSLVDGVFASCEAGVVKPALLDVALGELAVDASDATLVDDEPAELDGAAERGLGTILIRRSGAGTSPKTSVSRHPVATDLRQVVDLVACEEPAQRR